MPRIKDVFKLVRRRYAQARALVAGAIANRLPAIGFKGTHKVGGGNRTEITQAAFPDELSDARRSMPGP